MVENLGYKTFVAQGGDWGNVISTRLGFDHSVFCKAIHINILPARYHEQPKNKDEEEWIQMARKDYISQCVYYAIQGTRPQTLSYAMINNPIGIAVWIVEKFHFWSDIDNEIVETSYNPDDILTDIMVYIIT